MSNINNLAVISGCICSPFKFSHETFGEKFYISKIKTRRLSGVYDEIPIIISGDMLDLDKNYINERVELLGVFKSYNSVDGERKRLLLQIFVEELRFLEEKDESKDANSISLSGHICKAPTYRETPYGREISDLLVAVQRLYNKSDYIPCIAWGRNARRASGFEVGEHVQISGRIQSRNYLKRLESGELETRTAYEVSINKIEVLKNEDGE